MVETTPAPAPRFAVGSMAYLENYWVDVIRYSPKARNVHYQRIGQPGVRYMPRKQFERGARPG